MAIFTVSLTEITDDVISQRFNESQRPHVEKWVLQAYKRVWHAADWPWKFVESDLTVTALTPDATWTDLSFGWEGNYDTSGPNRLLNVYDDDGDELKYLSMREWNRLYKGYETTTGTPEAWTPVRAGPGALTGFAGLTWPIVRLGPTPAADATFSAYLELGPEVCNPDGGSSPLLPEDFTYACVYGAMSIGLRLENDPTWESMEAMFREEISLLLNSRLPETLAPNRSYGGPDNFVYGR